MVAAAVMESSSPASASAPTSALPSQPRSPANATLIEIENLDFFYGQTQALNGI